MNLGVYTWFPYQSSDRCIDVNDVTQLDSWVISTQGHFTKNTDLFPGKISKNLKGCPLKVIIRDIKSTFSTKLFNRTFSNGSVVWLIAGMEYQLVKVVFHQMNMTLVLVATSGKEGWEENLFYSYYGKDPFIVIGGFAKRFPLNEFLEFTSSYFLRGSAGMYHVLSNPQGGAAFLKYSQWNCG